MLPYPAFLKTLAKESPRRVYGVLGDAYLQNRVVSAILERTLDADARDFNLDTVRGNSSSVAEVLSLIANLPFLAERRAVVVTEIEKLDGIGKAGTGAAASSAADLEETESEGETDAPDSIAGEDDGKKPSKSVAKGASAAKTLSDGLKNLPSTTVLILVRTPETPDINARKKEARLINAAIDKIIEGKPGGEGVIVNCIIDPKDSRLATNLLLAEARERGIAVSPGIGEQLVERCGTDLQLLLGELEKCALFAGQGPITANVVAEMTQPALHNTTFDLLDAIIERRGAPALDIVRGLFGAGISPEQLLSQLSNHLRLLFQARALLDMGVANAGALAAMPSNERRQFPTDGMVALLSNPSQNFRAGKMLAQGRRLPLLQIQSALEMAFETDLVLKGVAGDGGFLPAKNASRASLEILIARLCGQ